MQEQRNWSMFVDANQPCMIESGLRCYNLHDILFNNDNNSNCNLNNDNNDMQNYNYNNNNNNHNSHIFQQQTQQQQQQPQQQQQQQQQQQMLDGLKCMLPSLNYNNHATPPQNANAKDGMNKTETNHEKIKLNVQTRMTETNNAKPQPKKWIINSETHQITVNNCDIWQCDVCFKQFKQKHRFINVHIFFLLSLLFFLCVFFLAVHLIYVHFFFGSSLLVSLHVLC